MDNVRKHLGREAGSNISAVHSGGGGGAAQVNAGRTLGGDGGTGSISYQFVRIV